MVNGNAKERGADEWDTSQSDCLRDGRKEILRQMNEEYSARASEREAREMKEEGNVGRKCCQI